MRLPTALRGSLSLSTFPALALALLSVAVALPTQAAANLAPAKAAARAAAPGAKTAADAPKSKTVAAAATTASGAKKADLLDWPNWRGPEQNGVSRETGLPSSWNYAEGETENLLWSNEEAAGISTPIIMRGRLYTLVRSKPGSTSEGEKVICLDAATGKKLWENVFNIYLSDVPAERVGWSCCAGDESTGRVYAMSVGGFLQCLDGETGKTLWSRSLNEEFGLLSTYGGRTNVPLVFEDLVIISAVITGWGEMAVPAHRFLAFDKNTGEVRWFAGTKPRPEDTTYSTPFLTVLSGQAALVFGSGDGGVYALQPRTGKQIWNYQLSRRGLNVSPVVEDGVVYMAHAEENTDNSTMGAIVALDGSLSGDITAKGEKWRAEGMVGKSSPLVVGGRVYACDDGGKMYVLDVKTGEPVCKPVKLVGTIVRASPVYADGKIYICSTNAFHVFEPTDNGVKVLQKLRLREEDEVSGSIAISHGRIYLPTGGRLYCIGLADAKPAADPRPKLAVEPSAEADQEPAQLQIVPAELLLKPGDKRQLTARLFNKSGQFIKEGKATYTTEGPGKIDENGLFATANDASPAGTVITGKIGELKGVARVRTVPPLPWKFDFNDAKLVKSPSGVEEGEPPITWIGARYRHKVRKVDGEMVMVKVTTIPKGTRSQSWMGPNDMHDYTVQADVRGALTNKKLPDTGLIAQRYTLDLMGASQQVQIRSWTPQLDRFSKSVKFAWKPDTWYTLKFKASTRNGKALLQGKVWPRGEKEPTTWTIEAEDAAPNLQGSPGLFGNANDSEIYYDNITVKSNDAS